MSESDISVIIATFGDRSVWSPLADKAEASVTAQTTAPREVLRIHRDTLAEARNQGARQARGEWLCFLDADDELDARYIEEMTKVQGDVRIPAVLDEPLDAAPIGPRMLGRCLIRGGNFIVIGAVHRRRDHVRAGGFHEWPCLEDWDYWIRVLGLGVSLADCPMAIYRSKRRPGARNDDMVLRDRAYHDIRRAHGFER